MMKSIPLTALLMEVFTGKVRSPHINVFFTIVKLTYLFQFSYGIGSFPYDDPNWWRIFMRHTSQFRWILESFIFYYAGQVNVKSFIRTAIISDTYTIETGWFDF